MIKTEYDEIKANLIKKSLEKDSKDLYIPIERRKGNDSVLNFVNLICFLVWGAMFIIIAIIVKSGRSVAYMVYHDLLWLPSKYWRVNLLKAALYTTIGSSIVCTLTIFLNLTRNRRKRDHIKRSLICCEIFCFIIGLFLIVKIF